MRLKPFYNFDGICGFFTEQQRRAQLRGSNAKHQQVAGGREEVEGGQQKQEPSYKRTRRRLRCSEYNSERPNKSQE